MPQKEEKIANNPAYQALVKEFTERRENKNINRRDIEIAANTGGGRISNFEKLTYCPTLITFMQWCAAAGIKVSLSYEREPTRLQIRKAVEQHKEKLADPGRIITQLQQENIKTQNKK